MAAGIGGRTIAEAKSRLSLKELRVWNEYRARGFLITARTHDLAAAMVARSMAGGKLTDYTLIKPLEEPAPARAEPLTPQQAMMLLGGTVAKRKG